MNLELQLQSIAYSILFGMFFSLTYNLCYRFFFSYHKLTKILFPPCFMIIHSILYFFLLIKINDGILNYYFLLCFFFGLWIGNRTTRKVRTFPKKPKNNKEKTKKDDKLQSVE